MSTRSRRQSESTDGRQASPSSYSLVQLEPPSTPSLTSSAPPPTPAGQKPSSTEPRCRQPSSRIIALRAYVDPELPGTWADLVSSIQTEIQETDKALRRHLLLALAILSVGLIAALIILHPVRLSQLEIARTDTAVSAAD